MSDKHFQQAYNKHMAGDRQGARELYERILKKTPKHVDARYMLGTLLAESGELEPALNHLKAAAGRMPDSPMIHTNLGNVYLKLGKFDQARDCYKRALQLNPYVPETLFNLGAILLNQGKLEEAASNVEKSLQLKPDFTNALLLLGKIHRQLNHPDLAAANFIKYLEHVPDSIEVLFDVGNIFAAYQHHDKAAVFYERILEIDPNNESARHGLAALTGETTAAAPLQHVQQLFDDMAGNFESHLGQLGYRAPEIFRDMIISLAGEQAHFANAVDLGCGTGLSGVQFRTMVGRLEGMDLSPKMVDLAREKNVYDLLAAGDICQYLEGTQLQYDLIMATDVFAYIGDLADVFKAVSSHSGQGAYFLFSTEEAVGQDYILRPTGRYAHSRGYIEKLAGTYGFAIAATQSTDLRMEGQQPIKGDLFVLRHV